MYRSVARLLSRFFAVKLDNMAEKPDNSFMKTAQQHTLRPHNVTSTVRDRIEASGERIWRMTDFTELSFSAVAQALSRLTRQGQLRRLGKGLYYRARETAFGPSLPNPAVIRALPVRQRGVFPAGVAAANLLGFTTQNSARIELATDGLSLPRLIVGKETVIHTRRPAAWRSLSETDAALLDFIRNRGVQQASWPRKRRYASSSTISASRDGFRGCLRFRHPSHRVSGRCSEPSASNSVIRENPSRTAGQPQSALSLRLWNPRRPATRTRVAGEGARMP